MNILNKYQKGEYDYLLYNKKKTWIIAIMMYLLSAAIFIIGYLTTGSKKNLLTVVAILGVLPASRALINAIMNSRVKNLDIDKKELIEKNIGKLKGLYNLYLTSYDVNFYLAHAVVNKDSLICYTTDTSFDYKKFEEHLQKHMKIEGINNILIKVFDNENDYINRLNQLNENNHTEANNNLYNLLINISL